MTKNATCLKFEGGGAASSGGGSGGGGSSGVGGVE